ncbi:MAG: FtsX-like permease family protein [Polyangia bacterium]|jgi:ABC-type lipoprotein release transport system permease subunit|nr:FtsX-like permease family protein [Polyangia bacterium]
MRLLIRTAWRNLFRQKRRSALAISAMAVSLAVAIPAYGLITGIWTELIKGITGMELGHLQAHNPAYPGGRALQSTLGNPEAHLSVLRASRGVAAAAARVHGYGLAATERRISIVLQGLSKGDPRLAKGTIRFGRALDQGAPWRTDVSRPCEVVATRESAELFGVQVGTVLEPERAQRASGCERLRIVGLLRASGVEKGKVARGAREEPLATLTLMLPEEDLGRASGPGGAVGRALIRTASPVAITGVEPAEERRITFLADRVVKGRYLHPEAKGEILIGSRLATSQRLEVGDSLFLQAATLDMSTGSFYRDFRVVGIFRTGVDGVDRSRVFLHLGDARKIMALGGSAHELVVRAREPEKLAALKYSLGFLLGRSPLRVTTDSEGKRAGSLPLPAPVTVFEPDKGDARLLDPDSLGANIGRVSLGALHGRRVYARARIRPARLVEARVDSLPPGQLAARLGREPERASCGVYVPAAPASALGVVKGASLPRVAGQDEECAVLRVLGLIPSEVPRTARGATGEPGSSGVAEPPAGSTQPLVLVPAPSPEVAEGEDEEPEFALGGRVGLVIGGDAVELRLVGVELAAEKALSGLHERVEQGAYPDGSVSHEGAWPALVTREAARRLGVLSPGATLLLELHDEEGMARLQRLRVAALLGPGRPGEPELVLPYFEAQQVDSRRLNARAHEIALGPAPGAQPEALAAAVRTQLRPLLRTWEEIAPQMKEVAAMQNTFMGFLLLIIFVVSGTTVMNTMLMAVFERTREFGVMKSLGMRPLQVSGLIVMETLLLAVIAAIIGGAIGVALGHHLSVTGIDMSGLSDGFTAQGSFINPVWKAVLSRQEVLFPMLLLSLVSLVVSLYPAFRAARLKPVEAMRHRG